MPSVHKRIELKSLFDIMGYLPIPQVKEVAARFERIRGYGKDSIRRLQLAYQSGELKTPIFFSKIMSSKNPEISLTQTELEEEAAEFMITVSNQKGGWNRPEICKIHSFHSVEVREVRLSYLIHQPL